MRNWFVFLCAAVLGIATAAHAATVTVKVTPSFAAPSGIVGGYRAYQACDTAAALIGPAASGQVFSFQHDTANGNPAVEVRAWNTATVNGNPVDQEGTGNCTTLTLALSPPGATTTTYVCELDPVEGGTCEAQP